MTTGEPMTQASTFNVFQIADRLTAHALKSYEDEIDLIGYYGSYAQGRAKPSSDLDIFYIPADGKNPPVARTFLLNGILFDFWAIRWETMEGFATGEKRGWSLAPAIVHHTKILYARSQAQADRFAALQQKVRDLQTPEARSQMIQRALDHFQQVLVALGNLRLAIAEGDFTDVRHAGWQVILSVWESLALANQVLFSRGIGQILEQIPLLQAKPAEMEKLLLTISTAQDAAQIAQAAEQLVLGTRQVLRQMQNSQQEQKTAQEVFDQSYPEFKDGIRKVLEACQDQRPVAASASAWFVQVDLSLMLYAMHNRSDPARFNRYSEFADFYQQLGFPNLMQADGGELSMLAAQTKLLDARLRQWLQNQGVGLYEFESVEAFEESIHE